MNKKSFINALLAEVYIIAIVLLVFKGLGPDGKNETILIPIMMLSLFVLSAAVMGYLFLAEPIQLYLDGKKKEAVDFFLRTLIAFAVITIFVFTLTAIAQSIKLLPIF